MLAPKKIAVFASGTGSNFIAISNQISEGKINGVIKILISDNSSAKAIEFAKANNINYQVIDKDIIRDSKLHGEFLIEMLKIAKIDLIVLAGYLKMIPSNVISSYKNKTKH